MQQQIRDFIQENRPRFNTKNNNLFATAFSQIEHYFLYINIISSRCKPLEKQLLKNLKKFDDSIIKDSNSHPLTNYQEELIREQRDLSLKINLEIESSYLFAKILLDKIAKTIEFYFGPERGLSLNSHSELNKSIEQYVIKKSIEINPELKKVMLELEEDISGFRDKQIAHICKERNPRIIRGISFADDKKANMVLSHLYPDHKDASKKSASPEELLLLIAKYIEMIMKLIEENIERVFIKKDPEKSLESRKSQ